MADGQKMQKTAGLGSVLVLALVVVRFIFGGWSGGLAMAGLAALGGALGATSGGGRSPRSPARPSERWRWGARKSRTATTVPLRT